jgi:hypothetical protein
MGRGGAYIGILVGKLEGKSPPGKTRLDGDIKMHLQEVGCGVMDWIELAQDSDSWRALVNAVMNFRITLKAGNFITS